MNSGVNLNSSRARKARLARRIGKTGYLVLVLAGIIFAILFGSLLFIHSGRTAYICLALALVFTMMAIWYHQDLEPLPPEGAELEGRLTRTVLGRLKPGIPLTPKKVWQVLYTDWQAIFFSNHLMLSPTTIANQLSDQDTDMAAVWTMAAKIASDMGSEAIESGHVVAGLFLTSPSITTMLTQMKLSSADVEAVSQWLGRLLTKQRTDKPYFGGIGRDWANGFTPQLNRFGHNISLDIESHGGHFSSLVNSPGVSAIKNAFSQGASAIALIGPTGIGKTSHVTALAQLLLAEKDDRNLEHRQIISLNASFIISSAQQPGQIEYIILRLLQETIHAGHILLFLDDAQLFFSNGPGAFDASQILLPVLQSRNIQIIFALTPNDYQALKSRNPAFAALLTPVVITEPDQSSVMLSLEDNALVLELQHNELISYQALVEAYRLSGRYDQEEAYPGKAIQLLEQALSHADQQIVTAASVQAAIEQTHGVKVSSASPVEADVLLRLEDIIHQRMINQSRAVTVVSNALRRARAGVANPKRPIGSFLFLGPTGVGKTELAKAIADAYFGTETNMIRLDMSEYQQAEDVSRLLSDGNNQTSSLILAVRQQPFSVVLLDEIEKAHINILNLLLQLLDEGQLTDSGGRPVSFKDCIIIATSNAGAQEIRERVTRGEKLESFESTFIDNLINSNQFKPELLNRFDEIVLFRPLDQNELMQVVALMISEINKTLSSQNISVQLTEPAARLIVAKGYDARLGARPMRRMLQRTVEDEVANRILRGAASAGDKIVLDASDLPSDDLKPPQDQNSSTAPPPMPTQ